MVRDNQCLHSMYIWWTHKCIHSSPSVFTCACCIASHNTDPPPPPPPNMTITPPYTYIWPLPPPPLNMLASLVSGIFIKKRCSGLLYSRLPVIHDFGIVFVRMLVQLILGCKDIDVSMCLTSTSLMEKNMLKRLLWTWITDGIKVSVTSLVCVFLQSEIMLNHNQYICLILRFCLSITSSWIYICSRWNIYTLPNS